MGTRIRSNSRVGGGNRVLAGIFLLLGLIAAFSLSFAQLASASPLQPAGTTDVMRGSDLECDPQIIISATEGDHTYGAYQLFDGDLSGGKLTNIKWGSGIDSSALLTALNASSITELKNVTSAAQLAEKLAGLNSDQVIQFSKIATKHVTGTPKPFTKSGDAPNFTYTATLGTTDYGYYLVKDTDTKAAALTSPILKVLNCRVEENAKGSVPTSTKKIKEDSTNTWGKTADFEIGEEAPFKLTGTMPSNLADFTTYKYGFTDFISKGFTLPDNIKTGGIKVTVGGKALTPDTVNVTDITDESEGAEYKDGKKIEILFNDLKATAKTAGVDLTAASVVTVDYSATVNENAVVGGIGNPNKSLVVYEKDVNGGVEGKTPPQEVWAFTYRLDTTKEDSADSSKKLENAGFVLYNSDKTKSAEISNGKVVKWVTGDGGTVIESDANGVFNITGLDADTYFLKEVTAPSGYNLPEGDNAFFKFVIASTLKVADNGKGTIEKLTITAGTNPATNGDTTKGSVAMTITNTSGSTLPGTGGIGTVIFTVVGLLVMAGAAGGFVWRRRKQNS